MPISISIFIPKKFQKFYLDFKSQLSLLDQKLIELSAPIKILLTFIPSVLILFLSFSNPLLLSLGLFWQISIPVMTILCSFVSGYSFLRGGYLSIKALIQNLKKKNTSISVLDMNTLVSLSIISSLCYGMFFLTAAPLAIFVAPLLTLAALDISSFLKELISNYINKNSKQKLDRLEKDRLALEQVLDINKIKKGTKIQITAQSFGAYIPVDGFLLSDSAEILEGTQVSGEDGRQRTYRQGEKVYAQTIYTGDKDIIIEAACHGPESISYKAINNIKTNKSEISLNETINIILSWFVAIVLLVALLAFTVWSIASGLSIGFIVAMDVIFAACPCALGIAYSFPLSILKTMLFSKKILLHNEEILDRFTDFDTIVFDKTGTLTELSVSKVNLLSDVENNDLSDLLLGLVKYAEQSRLKNRPTDSYALAIIRSNLFNRNVDINKLIKNINTDSVNGILIKLDTNHESSINKIEQVYIGSKQYLLRNGFELLDSQSDTCVYIGFEQDGVKKLYTRIDFEQKIRTDALHTIEELKKQNIEIHMLTGDSAQAADKVAKELRISSENIKADCLLENNQQIKNAADTIMSDKELYIDELIKQGKKVLFVGDGLNDRSAAKLANAGSIAMGAASDMSGEFDITIEHLSDILILKKVIRYANRIQRQVLGFSLSYNIIFMFLAAVVLPSIGTMSMAGCFGVCMAFSSAIALVWAAVLVPIIIYTVKTIRDKAGLMSDLTSSQIGVNNPGDYKAEYISRNHYEVLPDSPTGSGREELECDPKPEYDFYISIKSCIGCTSKFTGYLDSLRQTLRIKKESYVHDGQLHHIRFSFTSTDSYHAYHALSKICDKFGDENITHGPELNLKSRFTR